MKNSKHLFAQVILPIFLLGCILFGSNACQNPIEQKTVAPKTAFDASNEHMSHDFCSPDSNWKMLQSPINIVENNALNSISFNYYSTETLIKNTGTTLEFVYKPGSSIEVNGKTYRLEQFHTHTPSEHHLESDSFAMEIHFVHVRNDTVQKGSSTVVLTHRAVVAVFVKTHKDSVNAMLAKFIPLLPQTANTETTNSLAYTALDLMPTNKSYYTYHGSLTAHECTPNVTWLVLKNPIYATDAQIQAFYDLEGKNNRALQPQSLRTVYFVNETPRGVTVTPNSAPVIDNVFIGQMPIGSQLNPGGRLRANNAQYFLIYQRDGNLVIYDTIPSRRATPVWAAGSNCKSGEVAQSCEMQKDGNLVVYNYHTATKTRKIAWSSKTNQGSCKGNYLALLNDGNLVIYNAQGVVVWQAKKNGVYSSPNGYLSCPQ